MFWTVFWAVVFAIIFVQLLPLILQNLWRIILAIIILALLCVGVFYFSQYWQQIIYFCFIAIGVLVWLFVIREIIQAFIHRTSGPIFITTLSLVILLFTSRYNWEGSFTLLAIAVIYICINRRLFKVVKEAFHSFFFDDNSMSIIFKRFLAFLGYLTFLSILFLYMINPFAIFAVISLAIIFSTATIRAQNIVN